ncbi:MAG: alpha/beta hydrolase [Micavibrio aeruginosavorus]|uniref:Palmitoyl-protein thioesterase ABHD10, mitochondrial n=1 Tax=Micavibrio aeruginosavorus TaxID=349221 RepID=A0A7T5R2P9_9BACT|nr:MAG: alpha/beta hydrolase [Micavibrio aeruginosavorus]
MENPKPHFLQRTDGPMVAYCRYQPVDTKHPAVLFLGGFRSDMQGSKALYLDQACRAREQPFVRFDYRGHGLSGGDFKQGTIGLWLKDALDILDQLTAGPVVLVGSSMGGWIGLLLARCRPARICGFIGVAAAPDFTRGIWDERMSAEDRKIMQQQGFIQVPNHYGAEPYVITQSLIEDGARHYILETPPLIGGQIHLVQGMKDEDVVWRTASRLQAALEQAGNPSVQVHFVEEGNHRLSRPDDLVLIDRLVQGYKL